MNTPTPEERKRALIMNDEQIKTHPKNEAYTNWHISAPKTKGAPKRRILRTRWGNWYGYEGTRRVESFGSNAEWTAEEAARAWLEDGTEQTAEERCAHGYLMAYVDCIAVGAGAHGHPAKRTT